MATNQVLAASYYGRRGGAGRQRAYFNDPGIRTGGERADDASAADADQTGVKRKPDVINIAISDARFSQKTLTVLVEARTVRVLRGKSRPDAYS